MFNINRASTTIQKISSHLRRYRNSSSPQAPIPKSKSSPNILFPSAAAFFTLSTLFASTSFVSTEAAKEPEQQPSPKEVAEEIFEKNTRYEPKDDFFQFGARRNTPLRQKDRNYEPEVQKTCSSASVHASRGPRNYMEDEHYVSLDGNFFGVFDGHGGSGVAEHLSEHIWNVLSTMLNKQGHFIGTQGLFGGKNLNKAFLETCIELQNTISKISKYDHVGSTATMVALDNNSIWSINVGDSRAVLCQSGKAINLSNDHKPNEPNEMKRITALGGRVKWYGWEDEDGEPVPTMGAWRINGNLACSRLVFFFLSFSFFILFVHKNDTMNSSI